MAFAFWRKCDFQIHTPRDPGWSGEGPIGIGEVLPGSDQKASVEQVDSARSQWAEKFVDRCIKEGLEAIALTDHHETVMLPYVQKEIARRESADHKFDLWIFPGMELTAHGGVQCLILFDAGLSEDWLRQAQGKLGIVYANLEEKAQKGVKVTQLTSNYADIASLLDEIEQLKGKFIVLPNVSQGGSHTVLKDGAHADFRRMPYVGGYLDFGQTLDTLGAKNKTRLSGQDKNWAQREIYPLPTSDSRVADFSVLGKNNTWIKLAAPTAEALRQAFLGHRSRICIKPPAIPSLHVSLVEIAGSTILQPTVISMSPELNSIIGGRGSGKSSFLEYLAFGLGRSCHDVPRPHYSNTERMQELIVDTLTSKGGMISIALVQDGATFRITRGPGTAYQPQITYPNGSVQSITTKELRGLFPAVVYSQGELAEIGKQAGRHTQLTDLLQFVNPDYKRVDDKLNADIEAAKATVKASILFQVNHWSKLANLRKLTTSRSSLRQRVEALEKTLPALSESDQAIVTAYDIASEFESNRLQASKHAEQIESGLATLGIELLNERDLESVLSGEPNIIRGAYKDVYKSFEQGISKLRTEVAAKRKILGDSEAKWADDFKASRIARDEVLEKLGAHKAVTAQIIKLREEVTEVTNKIADIEADIKSSPDSSSALATSIMGLNELNSARTQQTVTWAKEIEKLSSGTIRATVVPAGEVSEIQEALDIVAARTGSQESARLKRLEDILGASSASDLVDRLRTECLALLYWRQVGAASGEEQPKCEDLMRLLGGTERVKSALIELMDTSRVEAVAVAVSRPQIALTYCDGTREISFEKASEGQRAAALLFMLLEQPGGPLIIDQPEGDLDNRIIADLMNKLHVAKQNRQLIFASHNANIVVNGSSELVGHLDVNLDGKRLFQCSGAIDDPVICKVITSTMEGGEKAFKDRQDKYGY